MCIRDRAKVSVLLGRFTQKDKIISLLRSNLKGETDLTSHQHSLKAPNANIIKELIINVRKLKNTEIEPFTKNIEFELEHKLLNSGQFELIKSVSQISKFTTKNNIQNTALHISILTQNNEFLNNLGQIGIDFNLLDSDGNSCLFLCLKNKQYDKCKIIIKFGGKFIANKKDLTRVVIKAVKDNDLQFFK